jgi:hypothetical protein
MSGMIRRVEAALRMAIDHVLSSEDEVSAFIFIEIENPKVQAARWFKETVGSECTVCAPVTHLRWVAAGSEDRNLRRENQDVEGDSGRWFTGLT